MTKDEFYFARKVQPQISKDLHDEGVEIKEAKEIGKKVALMGQGFLDILNKKLKEKDKEKKSVVKTIRLTPTDAQILKDKNVSPTQLFDVSLTNLKEIIKKENCKAREKTKTPSSNELQRSVKW